MVDGLTGEWLDVLINVLTWKYAERRSVVNKNTKKRLASRDVKGNGKIKITIIL